MVHAHLRCTSPVRVYWPALCSYLDVRCRRCSGCMAMRQWAWTSRAAKEQAFANRTWFITLTYGPNRRSATMARASELGRAGSENTPSQRLTTASGWYVSNFCKTLRKRGFEFRYLCVPELHRDGFPHWHGLVHDQEGSMKWADVTEAWSAGFSVVKLVKDANALRYVTKYLCKGRLARVRASLKYGDAEHLAGLKGGGDPSNACEASEEG